MVDAEPLVRAFYAALDEHEYEELTALLDPDFTQYRPDRTFDGREAFVSFMRDGRPMTETTHELGAVFTNETGVAAQGQLLDAEGEPLFRFVDVHTVSEGLITSVRTYTQGHPERVES